MNSLFNKIKEKVGQRFLLDIQVIKLVIQQESFLVIRTLFYTWVCGLLPALYLFLTRGIIDLLSDQVPPGVLFSFLNYFPEQKIEILLISMAFAFLLDIIFKNLFHISSAQLTHNVSTKIQDQIHKKSVEINLEYFETPGFYNTLHSAQQDAVHHFVPLIQGYLEGVKLGVSLLGVLYLLGSIHLLLPLLLCLLVLPLLFIKIGLTHKRNIWYRNRRDLKRKCWYESHKMTNKNFSGEVRIYQLGAILRKNYLYLTDLLGRENLKLNKREALLDLMANSCAGAGLILAFYFLVLQTQKGNLTLGALILLLGLLQKAQSLYTQGLQTLAQLYGHSLFIEYYFEFMNYPKQVFNKQAHQSSLKSSAPLESLCLNSVKPARIVFDKVSYRYPHSTRYALRELSFSIEPGEKIALIGLNGSGKSTLIKLLCRLLEPTEGYISVNEIPYANYTAQSTFAHFSVLFQNFVEYDSTLAGNIDPVNAVDFNAVKTDSPRTQLKEPSFTKQPDSLYQTSLEGVLQKVQFGDRIQKLGSGLYTYLGNWLEKGENLSKGEWQKVALARMFYKKAPFLVLDEPSSYLDPLSEENLFNQIINHEENKSVIWISHRLANVQLADKIWVLDQGCLVETGTHQELLDKAGIYAKLFQVQAKGFVD